jgi:hypothetical protein
MSKRWREVRKDAVIALLGCFAAGATQAVRHEGNLDPILVGLLIAARIVILLPATSYAWHFVRAPAQMLRDSTAEIASLNATIAQMREEAAKQHGTLIPPGWRASPLPRI